MTTEKIIMIGPEVTRRMDVAKKMSEMDDSYVIAPTFTSDLEMQDKITGSQKTSSIYTGESLDNLTLVNTCYSTINANTLPAICFGIFGSVSKANAEPCVELSEIDPTQCSIPPAGSRFFNFKLEKDGGLHD